jgi:D-alanyl-D-alanine carboxypeptidase
MASTTKVMTALVALDYYKPTDILTTLTSHVEGVNVGVEVGDRLYFKDALYAMLLPSGNDIALMMAQNYPGGEDAFVAAMNKKAHDLHLTNTHYADPAGLDDDGNYTTASELAQLAAYASENPTLADVTATKSKIIQTVDGTKVFTLTNLNQLLGQYGVIGMKTGHTEGAGDVLITSAIDNGHNYIIVVMRSQDRFADTKMLLSSLTTDVTSFSPRIFAN